MMWCALDHELSLFFFALPIILQLWRLFQSFPGVVLPAVFVTCLDAMEVVSSPSTWGCSSFVISWVFAPVWSSTSLLTRIISVLTNISDHRTYIKNCTSFFFSLQSVLTQFPFSSQRICNRIYNGGNFYTKA